MATVDNRLPTEGTQLDIESDLSDINTSLGSVMSDTTGQDIVSAIETLTNAVKPKASDIIFSPSGSTLSSTIVEDAIKEEDAKLNNYVRRTRKNITSNLSNLSTAVAEQNLEKYGYSIGDYFVGASGYYYHLADMDTYYGGYNNQAVVNIHHIGIVVDTKANSQWYTSDDTSHGYINSTLHTFLTGTALNNIKSDFITLFGGSTGLEHLVSHSKLLTTAISSWSWSTNQYISALSEIQVYSLRIWGIDGYQTGEACKPLELFRKHRFNAIFGNTWFWLRDIQSSADACIASGDGRATRIGASASSKAVGLILFH